MEKDGHFVIDFEAMEQTIIEKKVKLFLLCNPHNPGGRVWSKEELLAIGRICQKHQVVVVSDEIHQDIVLHQINLSLSKQSSQALPIFRSS